MSDVVIDVRDKEHGKQSPNVAFVILFIAFLLLNFATLLYSTSAHNVFVVLSGCVGISALAVGVCMCTHK